MTTAVTKTLPITDGVKITKLDDWIDFTDFVSDRLDYRGYIWRGQQDETWKLQPTLERVLKTTDSKKIAAIRKEHLKRFKYATRGRRGPSSRDYQHENEWWALGQHSGLATPLLDWTRSPYVAAYFAFFKAAAEQTSGRAIYGLSQHSVSVKSRIIETTHKDNTPPTIEFVDPLLDDNPRLVSQGGVFSRSPDGVDIETWVRNNFKDHDKVILHKVVLPNNEREIALRSLNRMNINHLTLFPDLYGASVFTNLDLTIAKY